MKFNLQVQKLFLNFKDTTVLKNISFRLKEGEILLVSGKNGSGKTSLLKIIAGLLLPTRGNIIIKSNQQIIISDEYKKYHSLLTDKLYFYNELTAYENIKFVLNNETDKIKEALLILDRFNLSVIKNKRVKTLSSGMYQKLRISITLAEGAPLLLLDEPENFLDKDGEKTLFKLLKEYKNKIIIITSNNKTLYRFQTEEISLD